VNESSLDINILRPRSSEEVEQLGPRSTDLLRAFTAISRALNLGQSLSLTLDLIAEKVSQTMGHKYCAIYLLEEETGELHIEGSYGLSREYVRALNTTLVQKVVGDETSANSVSATAFKTRMPIHVKDITSDPRFRLWRDAALKAGYNSVVSLPLMFRGEPIGVLNCYDEPRSYSEEQVEALVAVAEQAASAVGIGRLMLEQQRTIEELNALNDRLDALNQHVTAQHELLRGSEEIHETLTAILLEGRSLHEITQVLSELLRSPVVLQDTQRNILSQATTPGKDFVGIPAEESRQRSSPGFAELREHGRARKIETSSSGGSTSSLIATRVAADDDLYGYLSVPLAVGSEEDLCTRALEQAATVYALYMAKQRAARDAEGRTRGNLLADLLTGRSGDEADAREWARYLKLDFASGSHRVLVAKTRFPGTTPGTRRDARRVEQARGRLVALLRGLFSSSGSGAAAALGDYVAALVALPGNDDPNAVAERLMQLAPEEVPGLSVRVGISSSCAQPSELRERYEEIVALIDLAERLQSPARLLCYDDWQVYGLLIRASDREDIRSLAHKALDPLLAQDDGGQLLGTLQAFIENGLNMTRTATALYVHPNTIKYRLRKISESLGVNLSDLDDILVIKLALMVRSLNPSGFDSGDLKT
jgi:sugar diacid utilization regulator/GAF domain-containing protein